MVTSTGDSLLILMMWPVQFHSLKVLLESLTWSLTGYLLYMHLAKIHILGDKTQVRGIAQSDSVSEAAKIFTQNLMRLIQ